MIKAAIIAALLTVICATASNAETMTVKQAAKNYRKCEKLIAKNQLRKAEKLLFRTLDADIDYTEQENAALKAARAAGRAGRAVVRAPIIGGFIVTFYTLDAFHRVPPFRGAMDEGEGFFIRH